MPINQGPLGYQVLLAWLSLAMLLVLPLKKGAAGERKVSLRVLVSRMAPMYRVDMGLYVVIGAGWNFRNRKHTRARARQCD